ncbi:hypothetical protein [Megamonas rupellensis]|uniref:hypothetical protein n=2 Tax=Megamonas TaxID=158846 RepID=UPI0003802BA1|nr:hypothetical protein [Megamonas rupellensis]
MKKEMTPVITSMIKRIKSAGYEFNIYNQIESFCIESMINSMKLGIAKEKSLKKSFSGQELMPFAFRFYNCDSEMIVIQLPFKHKLIDEQFESIEKNIGKPDKIKKNKEDTMAIWYFVVDEKERAYMLNSSAFIIVEVDSVIKILDSFNLPMEIEDFVNVVISLDKETPEDYEDERIAQNFEYILFC